MKKTFTGRELALAGGLALGCALVMSIALSSLSRPKDFDERLALLERRTAEAERLARTARTAKAYRPGVICAGSPADQAAAIRSTLESQAGQTQLSLTVVDVSPEGDGGDGARLETLRVRFEAAGAYEAALGLLETLERVQPQIFVDTVDLVSKTSSVTLSFSGRAFCSV